MPRANVQASITRSSDFEITRNIHAVFQCDGGFVCIDFDFYDRDPNGVRYPRHFVLPVDEAILVGSKIEESGAPGDFPISAATGDVKEFGRRLRAYGEKGC